MRIIAGKYRRRKLAINPGMTTRPITDRAKETLFEYIGRHLPQSSALANPPKADASGELFPPPVPCRVADIFSGTGSLGLEALSRGAISVVCIENDFQAHELLKQNVAQLGVEESVLCWRTDVFRCSFRPKGDATFTPYQLMFFDPPYRMVEKLRPGTPLFKALQRSARSDTSTPDAMLVFRTPSQAEFEIPSVWARKDKFNVSSMMFHFFAKSEASIADESN